MVEPDTLICTDASQNVLQRGAFFQPYEALTFTCIIPELSGPLVFAEQASVWQ